MRKATAAQLAPEPSDEPELIVDREFKSPRPLDRNISTVTLKTPTNNPTEGYDLTAVARLHPQSWSSLVPLPPFLVHRVPVLLDSHFLAANTEPVSAGRPL
jgi:hypothetical protein